MHIYTSLFISKWIIIFIHLDILHYYSQPQSFKMKIKNIPLLAIASFASIPFVNGVLELNFTRALRSTPLGSRNNLESIKPFEGLLKNQHYWYSIDIQLGSPPQAITVDLDTGSSDLFVIGADDSGCDQACHSLGTFDSSKSNGYSLIHNGFSIRYGDGTGATGNWVKDNIEIGGETLPLTFAVSTESSTGQGVFGIGYASLGGRGLNSSNYTNYPKALVNAGIINSQTYSMYLNSKQANSGSVLFGGVDQTKYTGTLGTVPFTSSTRTLVTLNSLKLSDGSFISSGSTNVLLDTGTTLMYLPNSNVVSLAKSIGAAKSNDGNGNQIYVGPCVSNNPNTKTLDFTFGCVTIKVPLSNFQTPLNGQSGNNKLCSLDIIPTSSSSSGINILGDSFLRSAYIVFDLDNQQASIAQANLNQSGESDIQDIPASRNSIPGATVCNT